MLSERATRHAALRAPTGIGALHDTRRVGPGDGRTAHAEAISRLVLRAVDSLDRQKGASRTQGRIAEEYVERAYSIVTRVHR